ncbi:hypothetical protein SAMN06297251_10719 [Fulvimarina manganoxydans]|uniref:Uncharacterized protein n=1 Tax=Fulvimarina manganoxydans TaxID=937218 RepID=A0A1W2BNP2_9HYPH|nr:hypothetical protein SAMN06297251_10719 [Fulvimarina manganoxydans]
MRRAPLYHRLPCHERVGNGQFVPTLTPFARLFHEGGAKFGRRARASHSSYMDKRAAQPVKDSIPFSISKFVRVSRVIPGIGRPRFAADLKWLAPNTNRSSDWLCEDERTVFRRAGDQAKHSQGASPNAEIGGMPPAQRHSCSLRHRVGGAYRRYLKQD